MSKVLIDRELAERVCHVDNSTRQTARRELRTILAAPSGTPAMPVKAYYHEAPNEYGGLNKSVGLEVRKEFADAPLVLESDAVARIARLEGEIAKRDETIARLEPQLNRAIQANYDLREELAACRVAVENCDLFRARIAELEARIVWLECEAQVNAAPVSEAKAQGVGSPIRFWIIGDAGQKKGATLCKKSSRDGSLAFFETEEDATRAAKRHAGTAVYSVDYYKSAPLMVPERSNERGSDGELTYEAKAHNRCLDEVARLNAAPAQQVSVQDEMRILAQRLREYNQNPHHINPMSDAFHILVADAANALSTACVPKEIASAITWSEHLLFECGALVQTRAPSVHVYNKTFEAVQAAKAMLAASQAAPAADAGIVDMYRHLQKVTPYRFKKIQDASITDGGDVMYFHKDRFDAALLDDMAANCAKESK